MSQISLSGVAVEFGSTRLLEDMTFAVNRGERWGVVGRNGTGKTTLFRLITGEAEPARGTVARASGLRVSLLDQHRDFAGAETVWEVAAGPFAELLELERSLAAQAEALGSSADGADKALARYDRDFERFEREGGYTVASRVDAVLHGLGFDPQPSRERPVAELSGGERGRLGLGRQLVAGADVLLLDEPTNHLDLETTRWLEEHLAALDTTLFVISHDRVFLDRVVDHVLHLEAGTAAPYAAGYADFVRQRAERRLTRARAFAKQRRTVAAEEDFIRRNIAGQKSAQAKGRRRRLERLPRLSPPPGEGGAMALALVADARGGDQVLVLRDVGIAAGGRTLIEGFSARIGRGDRIGFVGPNGAGKSTLLGVLGGDGAPERGEVKLGASTRVAHYRQDLAQVPRGRSLYDAIHELRPMWGRGEVQAHLGRFDFSGDAVRRQAQTLSGGERARVALAMLALSGANLLLLDEPTNHLDVESIESIEDALQAYGGTFVLVSHDRALLGALTTRLWVLRDGRITDFPGGFDEWEAVSAERAEARLPGDASDRARPDEPDPTPRRDLRGAAARRPRKGEGTARPSAGATTEGRRALRAARRLVAEAEARVASLEARLAELQAALADPALYAQAGGGARATELGAELTTVERDLDRATEEWARVSDEVERLAAALEPR